MLPTQLQVCPPPQLPMSTLASAEAGCPSFCPGRVEHDGASRNRRI